MVEIEKLTYIYNPVLHQPVITSFFRKIFSHGVVFHQLLDGLNIYSIKLLLLFLDDFRVQDVAKIKTKGLETNEEELLSYNNDNNVALLSPILEA